MLAGGRESMTTSCYSKKMIGYDHPNRALPVLAGRDGSNGLFSVLQNAYFRACRRSA
jgi:hypothetical protein